MLRIIGQRIVRGDLAGAGLTGAFRAVKVVYRGNFENERSFAREFEGMSSFEPVSRRPRRVCRYPARGADGGVLLLHHGAGG